MDGVEQPLLLERFPETLNHAGPFDALACQGSVKCGDSVTQLLGDGRVGDGRALPHGGYSVILSLNSGEHCHDLLPINKYTAYFAYIFYIMTDIERPRRDRQPTKSGSRGRDTTAQATWKLYLKTAALVLIQPPSTTLGSVSLLWSPNRMITLAPTVANVVGPAYWTFVHPDALTPGVAGTGLLFRINRFTELSPIEQRQATEVIYKGERKFAF